MFSWSGFLLVGAVVGGLDVSYFHVARFRLAARTASRGETAAHLAQAASFVGLCACAIAAPDARGWVLGLFGAHFAAVAADVVLERRSRAELGGVPPAEAVLHVLGSVATMGALAAYLGAPGGAPAWQRLALAVAAAGGVCAALVELVVLVGAGRVGASARANGVGRGVEA